MSRDRLEVVVSAKDVASGTFKKVSSSAGDFKREVTGLSAAFKGLAASVTAYLTVSQAVQASLRAITAASDLEEVQNKFDVVFRGMAKESAEWAKTLRQNFAMSEREAKQYLASIQDLLVPMGMARESAGQLSNEIVQLSADLGSFNNVPTAQVMDDITSALVGNYETMKKYGVVLNVAVVEQEALAMGLARSKDQLTASHKAQAAYALMVKGSADAIGDMARSSGSYANQLKAFRAQVEDTYATIGKRLLPAATDIVKKMNEWLKANEAFIGQKADEYVADITSAAKSFQQVLSSIHSVYAMFPAEVTGAAGIGIVGRILLGSWTKAGALAAIYAINDGLGQLGMSFGNLKGHWDDYKTAIGNISDVAAGRRDPNTGELIDSPTFRVGKIPKGMVDLTKRINIEITKPLIEAAEAGSKPLVDTGAQKAAKKAVDDLARGAQALVESLRTPAEVFQADLATYQLYLDRKLITTEQYAKAFARLTKSADDPEQQLLAFNLMRDRVAERHRDMSGAAGTWMDAGIRSGGAANEAASAAFEAHRDQLEKTKSGYEDLQRAIEGWGQESAAAIADFAMGAKGNFSDMINSMIRDMLRMMAYQWITKPLFGWLGGKIGATKMHSGGVVGASSGGVARVNPAVFAFAPRLHSGLAPDEFPAILQRGERVIPRRDAARRSGGNINTTIHVTLPDQGMPGGGDPEAAKHLGSLIGHGVRAEFNRYLTEQMRPGGLLNRRLGHA